MHEVRGSVADFRRLLLDERADEVQGRELAQLRLTNAEFSKIEELRAVLGDDALAEAAVILAADPDLIEALGRIGTAFGGSKR